MEATVKAKQTNSHSRLTNNSPANGGAEQFLGEIDHRSRAARRYRDICAGLAVHLGGETQMSEVRRHLARRAAALIVWAENEENKLVLPPEAQDGPPFDVTIYATAVNSMRRLLLDLGLNPHLKVFAPDLKRYLDAVIDVGDTVDMVTEPVAATEPLRRDSRGRPRRGTPEQIDRAKHMRETAAAKKAERETDELKLVREAVETVKAERVARQADANKDET